jgi:hypothetical protein
VAEQGSLIFPYPMFQWIVAYSCFHISSFHDFLISFLLLFRCFSSIFYVYLGAPLLFHEIQLLIKKKL